MVCIMSMYVNKRVELTQRGIAIENLCIIKRTEKLRVDTKLFICVKASHKAVDGQRWGPRKL